jgi:peptidoglycan glycosyltransferase
VRFATAWARKDYAAMYSTLDYASQRAISADAFAGDYQSSNLIATVSSLDVTGRPRKAPQGAILVPVAVHTVTFGTLHSSFVLRIDSVDGIDGVAWSSQLLFPGLRAGEHLRRHLTLPRRAALLARDGSVLASGPASTSPSGGVRPSPLGDVADTVVGETGPVPASERAQLEAQGVPSDSDIGLSGLELALDSRLRGRAGGVLEAGHRVIARVTAQPASPVRTTISPAVEQAAVLALGGQLGGVVAIRPSDGEVLAVAGLGIDDLQPPGSTFKMITLSAVLQYGLATPDTIFPYHTAAVLDGVELHNANSEDCGGTLALAFAVSCNSVFAPLGAKLGAARLVKTAKSFGFNQPVGIPGAAESTLPPASQIQGDLAVGSTAIGQDMVQASALGMTLVAATIADGGRRPFATFLLAHHRHRVVATTAAVARTVRRLMIDVVQEGTGYQAAIAGVTVAGKTGTAELTTTVPSCPAGAKTGSSRCPTSASLKDNPKDTDAWFAAFAPALAPRVAVGVMLVRDGAGGDTAAPVAREVLEAALANHD